MKWILTASLLLCSCATPEKFTSKQMVNRYDKNTQYAVEDFTNGFTVSIYYSRYQYIPESTAVIAAAKSNITAICYDVADSKGKKIEPLNDQRIRVSTGRNGFSGITSCTASVKALYK